MTSDCAVCYVSDLNFLLPSLVSAAGVRKFIPPHKADIFVFTVGIDAARVRDVDLIAAQHSIRVLSMDDHVFSDLDKDRLSKTYSPTAMFGRLFMDDFLPSSCQRIVYLDGDTWIERDPTRLVEAVVPEGRFAAAEDTISFRQNLGFGSTAKSIKHHFGRLGLKPKNGYFNSGVFAASRATWKTIAREAYSFYLKNAEICEHSKDQTALNAIMGDRRLRLSNKWNFQTQLKFWEAGRYIAPVIYHFNRFPKPWMGICPPWEEMYARYEAAIVPFSDLNLPLKKLGDDQTREINVSTNKTYSYLRIPFVSEIALMAMGYKKLENNSWL